MYSQSDRRELDVGKLGIYSCTDTPMPELRNKGADVVFGNRMFAIKSLRKNLGMLPFASMYWHGY